MRWNRSGKRCLAHPYPRVASFAQRTASMTTPALFGDSSETGLEEVRCVRQGLELLVGSGQVLVAVALADTALGVALLGGEQAGAMVVEER